MNAAQTLLVSFAPSGAKHVAIQREKPLSRFVQAQRSILPPTQIVLSAPSFSYAIKPIGVQSVRDPLSYRAARRNAQRRKHEGIRGYSRTKR